MGLRRHWEVWEHWKGIVELLGAPGWAGRHWVFLGAMGKGSGITGSTWRAWGALGITGSTGRYRVLLGALAEPGQHLMLLLALRSEFGILGETGRSQGPHWEHREGDGGITGSTRKTGRAFGALGRQPAVMGSAVRAWQDTRRY